MIRVIKHVIVEPTPDRHARIARILATIQGAFPEATTDIVQGLLDDDLVVEVRLPLDRLDAWRSARGLWTDFNRADDTRRAQPHES
ncbi:hypothetical protein [Methylobacterium planeticum]|uniref:Uncharacterized protein n=1 Tax=Methylobacterium planeticum TaxID=2615211 RepID=A0A6N6MQW6_9HYPH|nr:hypothetical protein [Methylobacterium planeticum]KAB1072591.1 hypothetical protein F6X51_14970 [Methylobacterium planeticum]